MRLKQACACRTEGSSLIEVLVAMAVVATGVLALAALLQAATRQAKASESRATATLLAGDIADRIRANGAGAAGYDFTGGAFPSASPPPHADCTRAVPCEPADRAGADLAGWMARVRATLPKGSGRVQFHAGMPDAVDVWVGWADPLAPSPGAAADPADAACPAAWTATALAVRCVYLRVAP